jgi:hypothetical protein
MPTLVGGALGRFPAGDEVYGLGDFGSKPAESLEVFFLRAVFGVPSPSSLLGAPLPPFIFADFRLFGVFVLAPDIELALLDLDFPDFELLALSSMPLFFFFFPVLPFLDFGIDAGGEPAGGGRRDPEMTSDFGLPRVGSPCDRDAQDGRFGVVDETKPSYPLNVLDFATPRVGSGRGGSCLS